MTQTRRMRDYIIPGAILTAIMILFMFAVAAKAPDNKNYFLLANAPPVISACVMTAVFREREDRITLLVTLLFTFLFVAGNSYQLILGVVKPIKIVLLHFAAAVCAASALALYVRFIKKRVLVSRRGYRRMIVIVGAVIVILFLSLLLFGVDVSAEAVGDMTAPPGNARLWLRIGSSFTIQPTEIIKLLYVFLLALIYNSNMSIRHKVVYGVISLGVSSLFLALLSEFGTVLILFVVYLIGFFVHTRMRFSLLMMAGAAAVLIIGLAVVFGTHELLKDQNGFIAEKLNKIHDRLVLADTGQATRALEGMINGGFFGVDSRYRVDFHSAEADFAPAGIAQCMGIVTLMMCLLAAGAIAYLVYLKGLDDSINDHSRYKLSFLLSAMLAVQTLVSLAGNIGLPCVGVGMPMGISAGGTQMLTGYTAEAFIIYGLLRGCNAMPSVNQRSYKEDGLCGRKNIRKR